MEDPRILRTELSQKDLRGPLTGYSKVYKKENIISSGYLTKKGGIWPSLKRRWFVMTFEDIKYYKTKDAFMNGSIEMGGWSLKETKSVTPCDDFKWGENSCMKIYTKRRTYFIGDQHPGVALARFFVFKKLVELNNQGAAALNFLTVPVAEMPPILVAELTKQLETDSLTADLVRPFAAANEAEEKTKRGLLFLSIFEAVPASTEAANRKGLKLYNKYLQAPDGLPATWLDILEKPVTAPNSHKVSQTGYTNPAQSIATSSGNVEENRYSITVEIEAFLNKEAHLFGNSTASLASITSTSEQSEVSVTSTSERPESIASATSTSPRLELEDSKSKKSTSSKGSQAEKAPSSKLKKKHKSSKRSRVESAVPKETIDVSPPDSTRSYSILTSTLPLCSYFQDNLNTITKCDLSSINELHDVARLAKFIAKMCIERDFWMLSQTNSFPIIITAPLSQEDSLALAGMQFEVNKCGGKLEVILEDNDLFVDELDRLETMWIPSGPSLLTLADLDLGMDDK